MILSLMLSCLDSDNNKTKIFNHACTDRDDISSSLIALAQKKLHVAYGHTSHGSQLMDGLNALTTFDTRFATLPDIHDGPFSFGSYPGYFDLGNPNRTLWADATKDYLDNADNTDINVIMWSWCGHVSSASEEDIDTYLTLMSGLEKDYPGVIFVYMTGHLDGSGKDGNLNQRNEQIRAFCKKYGKYLYDFADIESYDPDGLVNYMEKMCNDNCDYDSDGDGTRDKNWATDWQNAHPGEWYNCSCAHSLPLNGNMKAYAAWYMFSVLAKIVD